MVHVPYLPLGHGVQRGNGCFRRAGRDAHARLPDRMVGRGRGKHSTHSTRPLTCLASRKPRNLRYNGALLMSPIFITQPFSSCTCDKTGVIAQVGGCSIRGYVFDKDTYKTAFAPDFPASSPWVTSVGATQVWLLAKTVRVPCRR